MSLVKSAIELCNLKYVKNEYSCLFEDSKVGGKKSLERVNTFVTQLKEVFQPNLKRLLEMGLETSASNCLAE